MAQVILTTVTSVWLTSRTCITSATTYEFTCLLLGQIILPWKFICWCLMKLIGWVSAVWIIFRSNCQWHSGTFKRYTFGPIFPLLHPVVCHLIINCRDSVWHAVTCSEVTVRDVIHVIDENFHCLTSGFILMRMHLSGYTNGSAFRWWWGWGRFKWNGLSGHLLLFFSSLVLV